MGEQPTKPKARRKLTRDQVQEILERNVSLYKDEESFVPYLIELAIYLMEYEYNWSESGASAPANLPELPKDEVRSAGGAVEREGKKIYEKISTEEETAPEVDCPHCGKPTQGQFVCPNCHNLTQ